MGGLIIALLAIVALIIAAPFLIARVRRSFGMRRRGPDGKPAKRNPASIRKN